MNRYLCLDYGHKRVGVAVSDPLGLTAQALPYLSYSKAVFGEIVALVEDYGVGTLVLGLPKDRDGGIGEKAQEVQRFASKLEAAFGDAGLDVKILFQDERYSTVAVTRQLIDADVSRAKRKQVVDSQAAAFILQGVLDKG